MLFLGMRLITGFEDCSSSQPNQTINDIIALVDSHKNVYFSFKVTINCRKGGLLTTYYCDYQNVKPQPWNNIQF